MIAGAIAGLAGQVMNIAEQRRVNRQQESFSREMWDKQGQRDLEFWNLQNSYNDPSAQMQRLKAAGLNPNLVYGNGATTQAAPLSAKPSHSISPGAAKMDISSLVQQTLMLQQIKSNIARTDAETKAIEARTVNQVFDNQVKERLGYDTFVRQGQLATERLSTNYQRELADWETFKVAAFESEGHINATHGYSLSSNSPAAKAVRAGLESTIQNAENAKALGDIRRFESVIAGFKANLAKQGISPDSPWYVKIVGDLLQKLLGFTVGDMATGLHGMQKEFINQSIIKK